MGGDGGAETGFFEGFVFVGRSLGVLGVGGFIRIGIAFGALEFIDGKEEEGGAFHGWCSLKVLSHRDCGFRVFGCWLGHGNNGGDSETSGQHFESTGQGFKSLHSKMRRSGLRSIWSWKVGLQSPDSCQGNDYFFVR